MAQLQLLMFRLECSQPAHARIGAVYTLCDPAPAWTADGCCIVALDLIGHLATSLSFRIICKAYPSFPLPTKLTRYGNNMCALRHTRVKHALGTGYLLGKVMCFMGS
jgi:hypothetical protein